MYCCLGFLFLLFSFTVVFVYLSYLHIDIYVHFVKFVIFLSSMLDVLCVKLYVKLDKTVVCEVMIVLQFFL